MQERLSTATVSWQANLAGFPDGYNLSHGKWMYQVVKDSMPDKEMHELVTTEQYCDMRGKMYNDGVEALVWHVSTKHVLTMRDQYSQEVGHSVDAVTRSKGESSR